MSLNDFIQPKKRKLSLKAAIKKMRSIWLRGPVEHFDEKLARVLDCSIVKAATVRETWEKLGFLCYDRRGLLTWRPGGF